MIVNQNFEGLYSPQSFGVLVDFTIPAEFSLILANSQSVHARWLPDSVAAYHGRWLIDSIRERAWRIRYMTARRTDGTIAVYYYAGNQQWVTNQLSSSELQVGDFTVTDLPELSDRGYVKCIFSQPAPVDVGGLKRGVRLFPNDDTPRVFDRCNLINCEPPPGSTVSGNTTIKDFNLVVRTDVVSVNGVQIGVDKHVDRIYGRFDPETWTYEDKSVPEDLERD